MEVPADVQKALGSRPIARAAFDVLVPSHQKEYLQWITSAKKPETRSARIAKMLEMLEGNG